MNTGRGWFIPLAGFLALFWAYQFHPGWVDDVRGWMAGGSEPHKGAGGWTADNGSHQPQPVATGAPAGRRVALVIGNEAYDGKSWSKVPSGEEDAEAVARILAEDLKFDEVIGETNLTRTEMIEAIKAFQDTLGKKDTAFFYYSGHGAAVGDENYLIPTDAQDVQSEIILRNESVALNEVMRAFEKQHTALNVVVLDACRNNPLLKAYGGGIGLKGVERVPPRAENVIAFAAAPGATARAAGDGELSPYTAALVAELPKQQPIHRLFGAVRERVVRATDYAQRPWLNVELGITPRYLGAVATPGSQSTVSDPEVVDASGPDDELSRLLSRCREHLTKQRYTYPDDKNALLCYREVLASDPDNSEAKRAFATMTAFYIESAEAALAEGKRDRVRDRIARLRRIDPASPAAAQLEQGLALASLDDLIARIWVFIVNLPHHEERDDGSIEKGYNLLEEAVLLARSAEVTTYQLISIYRLTYVLLAADPSHHAAEVVFPLFNEKTDQSLEVLRGEMQSERGRIVEDALIYFDWSNRYGNG